jgi:NAD(P)-dependent dehydrogenase (short-subunit alcohol dehydrogenase family)
MHHDKHDNKIVFVTGANRGIGKAIVEALLKHKVAKIYAAARNVNDLPDFKDSRVVPVALDITNPAQIEKAAQQAADIDVLINNAGVLSFASVVTGKPDELMRDMQVNYFGTLNMVNRFVPVIEKKGGGAIANIISIVGLAAMAGIGGYSASKAALFSATQAMRTELKPKKISVHGVFPGPIDTDMAKEFDMQKTSPQVTAENILAGIASGHEDIFPDPMSAQLGVMWEKDPKALERQFASM